MEATLKPFYTRNASFYPILIQNPDTFLGGWMDGLLGWLSYSVIPHALLVTLVAQRPFRICSATRWINGSGAPGAFYLGLDIPFNECESTVFRGGGHPPSLRSRGADSSIPRDPTRAG